VRECETRNAEMRTASIKSIERARLSRSNDRSCCCDSNGNVTRAFFVERLIIYLQTLRRLGHGFIGSRAWRLQVQFQFARARIHASISRSVPKFTRTRTFSRNRIRGCARARTKASAKNRIFLPGRGKTTTAGNIIRKYSARSKPRRKAFPLLEQLR